MLILNFLIFSTVSDILNTASFFFDLNVPFIWNLYNVFEFSLIVLIHYKYVKEPFYKVLLFISMLIFLIQFSIEFSIEKEMMQTLYLSVFMYIIFSLSGSIYFLKNTQAYKKEDSVYLYFNAATLIYFSSTLIFFNILPMLTYQDSNIWIIHNVIESISKLIIAYAFWKLPSRSIS